MIKFKKKKHIENQYFVIKDGKQVGEVWKVKSRVWKAEDYKQRYFYAQTRKDAVIGIIS